MWGKHWKFAAALLCAASFVAGCSGGSDSGPATVTVRETQPTVAAPAYPSSPAPAPPAAPAAPAPATSWTMPDLSGQTLQAAQDRIQALTGNPLFVSTSSDATGQGRMQVLDRGWQVCSSTPAPGETFTDSTSVDFAVVRVDSETCP